MEKTVIKLENDLAKDLIEEVKLIAELKTKSLLAMRLFFDDKIELEKVKVACVIYGLMLRAQQ